MAPLYGTLGYVLISEVLIVLGLLWLFIAMMIRKIRYEASSENLSKSSAESHYKVEEQPEFIALRDKNQELLNQLKSMEVSPPSSPPVTNEEIEKQKGTIRFLEEKLLQYEIVQEEISTLGALKEENEKLRIENQQLRSSAVQLQSEGLIKSQFQEFAKGEEQKNEDLKELLTDIESLTEEKAPSAEAMPSTAVKKET